MASSDPALNALVGSFAMYTRYARNATDPAKAAEYRRQAYEARGSLRRLQRAHKRDRLLVEAAEIRPRTPAIGMTVAEYVTALVAAAPPLTK